MDVNSMERAQAYADEIRWRLEVMQYRCRYNPDKGTYRRLPTRIRRFHNGVPTDLVAGVLGELARRGKVTGIVFNGEELDGAYRPTATQIRKDDSLKTGGDATYTVLQDLLLDGEADLYQVGESSACSGISTSEYHWDEAEVLGCPEGSQGVTYSIVGVQRDQATDLFSFSVRKVQAVTQHMPETVTACTDDRTVTTELWDNVYGQPGDWRWDSVVHDGGVVGIPEPCSAGQGTLISLDISENDDCTYKVKVERATSKVSGSPGAGCEFMRMRDWFQVQAMDLVKNAAASLSRSGVEVSNGVITRYESSENDDGTWNNRVTTTAERKRPKSARKRTVTPRFTIVEWTDTGMGDAASSLPDGYRYGSYESSLTQGGLYVNKYTGYSPKTDAFGVSCERTAYAHVHASDDTVGESAFPGSGFAVKAAGGGVVTSETYRKDETTGVVSRHVQTKSEYTVNGARRAVTNTLLGRTVEYTNRSAKAPLAEPQVGGKFATAEYVLTDGRLYDVTWREFQAAPAGVDLSGACVRTVFQHEHTTERTAGAAPGEAPKAGGGRHYRTGYSVDPQTGVVREQSVTVTELARAEASKTRQGTARATVTRVTDRNLASGSVPGKVNPGASSTVTVNDGGSVTVETVKTEPRVGNVLREQCQVTATAHVHQKETVLSGYRSPAKVTAGGGKSSQVEVSVDDQGVASERSTDTVEFDREYGVRTHEDALTAYQVIEHTSSSRNIGDLSWNGAPFTAADSEVAAGAAQRGIDVVSPMATAGQVTASRRVNKRTITITAAENVTTAKSVRGGRFSRGYQSVSDSELTAGGNFRTKEYAYVAKPHKWLDNITTKKYKNYRWTFKNLTQQQLRQVYDDTVTEAINYDTDDEPAQISIQRSINEFGLYDGSVGFTQAKVGSSWGAPPKGQQDDDEDQEFSEAFTWKEKTVTAAPLTELNPLSPRYVPTADIFMLLRVTWTTYAMGFGKGATSLNKKIDAEDGCFWASPQILYEPSTQRYKLVYVKEQKTTYEIIKAGEQTPSVESVTDSDKTDMVKDVDKLDGLGTPDD